VEQQGERERGKMWWNNTVRERGEMLVKDVGLKNSQ
jgi:hypothetical protein